jgi:peptide deformylase
MARLNIIKEPNPTLRKISKPVVDFSHRLHELLADMTETMLSANGVGLAAIQVGVLYRAAILLTDEFGIMEIINPKIVAASQPKVGTEGCLSCPGVSGRIRRPQLLSVEFVDKNNTPRKIELHGRDAVIASHEIDHMDGILFTDKIVK